MPPVKRWQSRRPAGRLTVAAACCCRKINKGRSRRGIRPLTWVVLWGLLANPTPVTSPLKRALAAYRRMDLSAPSPRPARRQLPRSIHRLTTAEVDRAAAEYQAGATLRQLEKQLGVNRKTVGRYLRARGVQLRIPAMTSAEIEQAEQLYAEGFALADVAARLGYHPTTIHLRLKVAGVAMRDTQGRER